MRSLGCAGISPSESPQLQEASAGDFISFDSLEKSQASGQPWEIFRFVTTGQAFSHIGRRADRVPRTNLRPDDAPARRDGRDRGSRLGADQTLLPSSHPLASFIPGLPPAPVQLTAFVGHFGDTDVLAFFGGSVYSGSFTDECELTCRSDKYLLNRKIPKEIYQGLCNHIFGDAGCGIDLALFTYSGAVSAIDATGTLITVPGFA